MGVGRDGWRCVLPEELVGATEIRKVMTALHPLVGSRVSGDRARHTATVRKTGPAARIFYATGNRTKAFAYSLLSGLAEPVGAGFAHLALRVPHSLSAL